MNERMGASRIYCDGYDNLLCEFEFTFYFTGFFEKYENKKELFELMCGEMRTLYNKHIKEKEKEEERES